MVTNASPDRVCKHEVKLLTTNSITVSCSVPNQDLRALSRAATSTATMVSLAAKRERSILEERQRLLKNGDSCSPGDLQVWGKKNSDCLHIHHSPLLHCFEERYPAFSSISQQFCKINESSEALCNQGAAYLHALLIRTKLAEILMAP